MKTYHHSLYRKRVFLLFLFLFLHLWIRAQDNQVWTDTVKELKYEVVDTTKVVEEPPTGNQSNYDDETGDDTDAPIETEYFLRKEFTGGFTDTMQLRHLTDSAIKALQNDEAFWYANETFKKREPKSRKVNFTAQPFFQTLLWLIIIGGFAAFLILYLYNSNAGLFRKTATISEEEIDVDTNDIFSINYQKEIDKAVNAGNYRLAVRLMFLKMLRQLSDKNIIQYKQDSTNFDYMMQLRPTAMYTDFFRLTRNYEYSWYGQFAIDKDKFFIIKNEFENFETKLNR